MLCNATDAGYVSARRDRSKAIKGRHEAIVPEELFAGCKSYGASAREH